MSNSFLRSVPILFTLGFMGAADQLSVGATSWPTVQFSPNPVNFGFVGSGGRKLLPVTVTNTGTSNLVIGGDVVYHGPFQFSISSDGCVGKTIDPGGSCSVELQFTPGDPELNAEAYYIIFDNATGGYQYVFLYGKSKKQ